MSHPVAAMKATAWSFPAWMGVSSVSLPRPYLHIVMARYAPRSDKPHFV